MNKKKGKIGLNSALINFLENNPDDPRVREVVDAIQEHIQVFTELGRKGKEKHEVIEVVYALVDRLMQETVKEGGISCFKGCAHCCKMNVDISPMEAEYIVDYCVKKNIPISLEYLRIQSFIPKEAIGFTPGLNNCVFLSKQNTCTIYPVRPIACRKYLVSTPAELCNIIRYPNELIGGVPNFQAEIIAAAIDNMQANRTDSMPKMLLEVLTELNQSNK